MTGLKTLAHILPPGLRSPVRAAWRKVRGNPEFHVLRLLADSDRIAIDVGANSGDYTVVLARLAKACVAFEPNPLLASAIEKRIAADKLGNVEVQACALSDRDTEITFRIPIVNGVEAGALATIEADNRLDGAEVRSYTVPCRRLDGMRFEPVGVMKIDAEGHETAVLEGARSLIGRDRPAVMIEVEERHKRGSPEYVRAFFEGYGYTGFFLLGRQVLPLDRFDAHTHQNIAAIEADGVKFNAVYANNFIFAANKDQLARITEIARSGRSL